MRLFLAPLGALLMMAVSIAAVTAFLHGLDAGSLATATAPETMHEEHVVIHVADLLRKEGGSRTAPLPRAFVFESRGPRTSWKCAQIMYARAERAHAQAVWHFRLPAACANANAEAPYRPVSQLGGIALYRGATLLAFLAGSGAQTAGPPPAAPPAPPRHRRKTITSDYWTRREGRLVHVTQVEEEDEGP